MADMIRRKGDDGHSHFNGKKISKDSSMMEIVGAVDSFMASLDFCKLHINDKKIKDELTEMQMKFGTLAGVIVDAIKDTGVIFTERDLIQLEGKIKEIEPKVPTDFLSFSTEAGCWLNESRVRLRELERRLVPLLKKDDGLNQTYYNFVNRLSVYLFCLAVEHSEPQPIKAIAMESRRT